MSVLASKVLGQKTFQGSRNQNKIESNMMNNQNHSGKKILRFAHFTQTCPLVCSCVAFKCIVSTILADVSVLKFSWTRINQQKFCSAQDQRLIYHFRIRKTVILWIVCSHEMVLHTFRSKSQHNRDRTPYFWQISRMPLHLNTASYIVICLLFISTSKLSKIMAE